MSIQEVIKIIIFERLNDIKYMWPALFSILKMIKLGSKYIWSYFFQPIMWLL